MIPKVRDTGAVRKTAAALLFLLVLQIVTSLYGRRFWLNLTNSEPIGLYRMEKFEGSIRRGELVMMRVPAEFRQLAVSGLTVPKPHTFRPRIRMASLLNRERGEYYC